MFLPDLKSLHSLYGLHQVCTGLPPDEKELDAITADSDIMSGPEGKTPSKLHARIADYHCKVKECRMQAMHCRRLMDGNYLLALYDTSVDVSRIIEE